VPHASLGAFMVVEAFGKELGIAALKVFLIEYAVTYLISV